MDSNPHWLMISPIIHPQECSQIVDVAERAGFGSGTYSDGSFRDHVNVCFLPVGACPAFGRIVDRIPPIARLLGIDVWPDRLGKVQISRWSEGDHYGMHKDHEESGRELEWDRKLSLYVSLSQGGGLEISKVGRVNCGVGEAIAFSSLVMHAAPMQEEGIRYSAVMWVPGPRWR